MENRPAPHAHPAACNITAAILIMDEMGTPGEGTRRGVTGP